MVQHATKLRRGEAVYYLSVSVCILTLFAAAVIGKRPWIVPVFEFLPLALAALFPVGLTILVSRRYASSLAMVGCVVLTGLFALVVLQAVLRQGP